MTIICDELDCFMYEHNRYDGVIHRQKNFSKVTFNPKKNQFVETKPEALVHPKLEVPLPKTDFIEINSFS